MLLKCSIVDENIELAQLADSLCDRVCAEPRVRYVSLDHDALPAFALDRRSRRFCVVAFFEVADRDIGALASEENGDRTAYAGIAAGDERHHVLKFTGPF